jgi:hypothetical protein
MLKVAAINLCKKLFLSMSARLFFSQYFSLLFYIGVLYTGKWYALFKKVGYCG